MDKIGYSSIDFIKGKYIFDGDDFYKIIPQYKKEILDKIIKNKDKLTNANILIPDGYYLTQDDRLCFRAKNLIDYQSIYMLHLLAMELDVKKIGLTIAKSMIELRSIGITYWDLHDQNVLVDKYFNAMLVDTDGVELSGKDDHYRFSIKRLVEIIFQMMTTKDLVKGDFTPFLDNICEKYHVFDVYDKKVQKKLYDISQINKRAEKIDIIDLVEKICEEEKIEEIKRRVYLPR